MSFCLIFLHNMSLCLIFCIYRQNSKYSDKHQNKGFSAINTRGEGGKIFPPPHFLPEVGGLSLTFYFKRWFKTNLWFGSPQFSLFFLLPSFFFVFRFFRFFLGGGEPIYYSMRREYLADQSNILPVQLMYLCLKHSWW